jgi:hypothetical protein
VSDACGMEVKEGAYENTIASLRPESSCEDCSWVLLPSRAPGATTRSLAVSGFSLETFS